MILCERTNMTQRTCSVDEKGRRYSPDPDRYHAMCRPCHRAHDGVASGEQNARSKLTLAQVIEIKTTSTSGVELARRFGVGRSAISMVRRGRNWKDVEVNPE